MTACFTNKKTGEKLKRYYYYRCTSTLKHDWQACSVKHISAERLENFCLENLERISVDKNYIENLVFRLNNEAQPPHRSGYEPKQVCSKFSVEAISNTLKFFLSELQNKKGIAQNLLTKKVIEKIIYSPENIKISLFYSPKPQPKSPAQISGDRAFGEISEKQNLKNSKNHEFVSSNMAPGVRLELTT